MLSTGPKEQVFLPGCPALRISDRGDPTKFGVLHFYVQEQKHIKKKTQKENSHGIVPFMFMSHYVVSFPDMCLFRFLDSELKELKETIALQNATWQDSAAGRHGELSLEPTWQRLHGHSEKCEN